MEEDIENLSIEFENLIMKYHEDLTAYVICKCILEKLTSITCVVCFRNNASMDEMESDFIQIILNTVDRFKGIECLEKE